jgi:UDP-2-acetamido-2,6-beta-L-arabino-hexul-4-ose reductase
VKVVVTGAEGFLGRHLRTRLHAEGTHHVVSVPRSVLDGHAFDGPTSAAHPLAGTDVVVHLAGRNRGPTDVVEIENRQLAERLVGALDRGGHAPPVIIFANSIQAGSDTGYGRGKRQAAETLAEWSAKSGTAFIDVVFQNLFGESGQPDYNSCVATFCHRLASGLQPEIEIDRTIELLHAQEAVQVLLEQFGEPPTSRTVLTHGHRTTVSEVARRLEGIAQTYARGVMPDLSDSFALQLFNTYRSFLYPGFYPFALLARSDARGRFVEVLRSFGGESQASFSMTHPGVTRGNHFHLRKVERFVVVKGRARIAVRPVYGGGVEIFEVSGDQPAFIDIPTLHTHCITNTGDHELCTLFWVNEMYDPDDSDTFAEAVQ